MRLDVLILTWAFTYTRSMCVRAVKVLGILRLRTFNKDQKSNELAIFFLYKATIFVWKVVEILLFQIKTNYYGWWHLMGTYQKPAHEFLVLIAHVYGHSLNMHW